MQNTLHAYLRQLGRNLKIARKRRGMKQVQVHEASGISYRHYQNIEAGKVNITVETLYRLSKLYEVPVEELVKNAFL